MSMSQASRIAVITGAGSGIGAAVALALGGRRLDRRPRRTAPRDADRHGPARHRASLDPVVADVTDEASVRELFDTAVAHHGRVDLLFNNAGRRRPGRDRSTN